MRFHKEREVSRIFDTIGKDGIDYTTRVFRINDTGYMDYANCKNTAWYMA